VSFTANLKPLSLWRGIWASELEEVSTGGWATSKVESLTRVAFDRWD
jgi:hypothetical protein